MIVKLLETATLQEKAYRAIKDSLLLNHVLPGQEMLINALAGSLGISQTPVREAVARLSAEGLIEYTPRRTLRVAPITNENVRQVYDVRRLLEPNAAELAAKQATMGSTMAARVRDILECAERIVSTAAEQVDLDEYMGIDFRLHEVFLQAVDNSLLREVLTLVGERSLRIRTFVEAIATTTMERGLVGIITREHLAIAQAVLGNHPMKARAAVLAHLDHGEARTLQAVREKVQG